MNFYKRLLTASLLLSFTALKASGEVEVQGGVTIFIRSWIHEKELIYGHVGGGDGIALKGLYNFDNQFFLGGKVQEIFLSRASVDILSIKAFMGKKYHFTSGHLAPKINFINFGPMYRYNYDPMVGCLLSLEAEKELYFKLFVKGEVAYGITLNNTLCVTTPGTREQRIIKFSSPSLAYSLELFFKTYGIKYGAEVEVEKHAMTHFTQRVIINFLAKLGGSF
jgi:hypothetical protein